jgi:hypothetical protein
VDQGGQEREMRGEMEIQVDTNGLSRFGLPLSYDLDEENEELSSREV